MVWTDNDLSAKSDTTDEKKWNQRFWKNFTRRDGKMLYATPVKLFPY